MALNFTPQFHKKVTHGEFTGSWIALPQPVSVVPFKTAFYVSWQAEELQKLQDAGEKVVVIPSETTYRRQVNKFQDTLSPL